MHSSCTELKALANPPRGVDQVLDGVMILLGEKQGWAAAKAVMADVRNFVQRLRSLKNKIDRGEDFSKGIKYNENMLQEPEM